MRDRVALVTGASAGIGQATALSLLDHGWSVVAGARRLDRLEVLARRGAHVLSLDVTRPRDRERFVGQALSRFGTIDVLVNNAGVGPLAALEDSGDELWHEVFETNLFAAAALTRLSTPSMRAAGSGRVVTIGSMGGEFVTPLGGVYHASKYAVEAFTDALRAEMRPFGVKVVLVQPGPVRTALASTAADVLVPPGSAYAPAGRHVRAMTHRALESGRGFLEPQRVADVVVKACEHPRPRSRYKVGGVAHVLPALRRWLPVTAWDSFASRQAGLTQLGPGRDHGPTVRT